MRDSWCGGAPHRAAPGEVSARIELIGSSPMKVAHRLCTDAPMRDHSAGEDHLRRGHCVHEMTVLHAD